MTLEADSSPRTLVVRRTSGDPVTAPVGTERITLGRVPESTIPLADSQVSRSHAAIEVRDGQLVFIDLGSSNGSLVNGQRVKGSVPLNVGDVIAIGNAEIICQA